MDMTLLYIIAATAAISFLSLCGAVVLLLKKKTINEIIILLVTMSAGTLMGGAFFHLLPEAFDSMGALAIFPFVMGGFILFFLIERLLSWRHCHDGECEVHSFGYMNLVGDSIHNFLDGLVVSAAFIASPMTGIATAIAIAMHELPQEIGDFGVLIHSGFKNGRALIMNFIVSSTVIIGGMVGFLLKGIIPSIIPFILPIAAGGFIYIATTDLMPEIKKESRPKHWFLNLTVFIISLVFMYAVKVLGE